MWKRGTRHTRETHRFPSPRWIGTLRSLRTPAPKGPAVRFTQVTATHLVKKRRARRRVAQAQCMSPTGAIRTSSVVSCRQGNGSAAVFAGDSGCFCGELCLRDKQKKPAEADCAGVGGADRLCRYGFLGGIGFRFRRPPGTPLTGHDALAHQPLEKIEYFLCS